jgi:DNA (cytosine-5)-methyltransferase 1
MKEVIRIVRPNVFVAENVRGLINIAKGRVLAAILNEFESLGYHVRHYLVDAARFGVPQHRERLFIVGSQNCEPKISWGVTHGEQEDGSSPQLSLLQEDSGIKPFVTVRDAIRDLDPLPIGAFPDHTCGIRYPKWYDTVIPHIKTGQRLYNFRHDKRTVVHTWEIPGVFGDQTSEEESTLLKTLSLNRRLKKYAVAGFIDGSPMGAEDLGFILKWDVDRVQAMLERLTVKRHLRERVPSKYDFKDGIYNKFQRLDWDLPGRTIITNVGNPRNMLHPSQDRAPSVRECARLMSFPDEFLFGEDITPESKYRMLGNAVPPLLAEVIARQVLELL